jgi:RNA recognition motif-containing protein
MTVRERDGREGKRKQRPACSLNFVLLPGGPRTDHNQTVPIGENIVKNLFVGNLNSEVTPEELRRLFEAYGQVVQVHIIRDRDTGMPRFAFVEMTNDGPRKQSKL